MTTPETPKEHVKQSVTRQKKAATTATATARKLAKQAEDKAEVLAKATELLSARVGTLADAVQTNNAKIDQFQSELNKKPDDVELKLIASVTQRERRSVFRKSVGTAILVSLLSGVVAYETAQYQGHQRCQVNDRNIGSIVRLLESLPNDNGRFTTTIADLKANQNDC